MIHEEHTIMRTANFFTVLIAIATSGCVAISTSDKPPIAEIDVMGTTATSGVSTVKSTDTTTTITAVVPFAGMPLTVTLDGSKSVDPEGGRIAAYVWRRTDFPAGSRFAPDGGPPPDSGLPLFTGDPPAGPQAVVMQSKPGKYRYTLWVQDQHGTFSIPVTVVLQIGVTPPKFVPMPEATCMGQYMSPKKGCADCVCTPNAMGGCLDEANRCFANSDAMFSTVCSAAHKCAQSKTCAGTTCLTQPSPCMAELMAAATYMGGTIDQCSMPAMADANPCAASAALFACETAATSVCAATCK